MEEKNSKEIVYIPLDEIIPNRFQPRLAFDEKELNELANSILKYGVIQPIVVRQIGEKYEIIAGERRYKASTMAGIKKIPAIVKNTDDNTSAEIALLENLQRKNLTVIEEAKSFKKLMDRGFKQETIASKLGISQSSIANKIRLLSLPKSVQNSLLYNKISERHARCLLTLPDEQTQKDMLGRIVKER
jgi:ParB family chromosome partitioning protein